MFLLPFCATVKLERDDFWSMLYGSWERTSKLLVSIQLSVTIAGFRATYSSRRRKYFPVGSASASMQKTLLE